jgi:uncharacterized membrane-anchored protein
MKLPADHPQRTELNDEVHARPPEALTAPLRASYLALFVDPDARERETRHVEDLCRRFGVAPPSAGSNHFHADLGPFRLRWERHTEFTRYLFIVDGAQDPGFAAPALSAVPPEWIEALPGSVMAATHVSLVRDDVIPADVEALSARVFGGNTVIGAAIAGGAASAFTDFRIHADGFGRLLLHDRAMTPRQAGRMVQRLLEIDTYRVMALLAFPLARQLAPALGSSERELAKVTAGLVNAEEKDEAVLLERLTRLAAEIESHESRSHYRFAAASAYHDLVRQRIIELREERIPGLQTFHEFIERRLAPAMNTCRAVALRLDSLSRRIARFTQLLSTRVDLTRERQNQAVLESMNRRAKLQLRLQQTVEGLSVAAVTYYVVGLVGYAAKSAGSLGLRLDPDVVVGATIPLVAFAAFVTIRRIRRNVGGKGE